MRPFPGVDAGRQRVSERGGDSPLWSPDGKELFYRSGDEVIAIPVNTAGPEFSWEAPKILFRGTYVASDTRTGSLEHHSWDIHPDGRRFLMMKETEPTASAGQRKINVVVNWTEELNRRVPKK